MGAMPATVTGKASRAYLERELKAAVSREDFKRAASLKRLIDSLDKKEET
jgi:protein-arginine kinase activator protein McsA